MQTTTVMIKTVGTKLLRTKLKLMRYATTLNGAVNCLSVGSQSRLASDGFRAALKPSEESRDWPQTGLRRL